MGLLVLLQVLLVAAAAARAPAARAWGVEGHYMTCKIAEGLLTSEATTAVKGLLPGWANGELAGACSWPDIERRRMPWSGSLHFADTPGDCKFSYARDCHGPKGEKDMCVVGGINNYTAALQDSSSPYNRTESLLFLAHFLGDVHQPMHCGRTADLGGNTILVTWYSTAKTNLHKVWDDKVIQTAMSKFYKDDLSTMIDAIKLNLTEDWCTEENQWTACSTQTTTCADKYAEESAELSCPAYVGVGQYSNLEDEYFFPAMPVVEKRIAQGGVRLAAILNRIFSGENNSRLQSL
ncbi:hypothetical protein CFC21_032210 [Triticum aestivum]|uniref:Aspergillus nuclease S1 n=2 Tax=Triticum aestivum TaxID=4565 RepID=A0A3B6DKC3_WHEAT|nr:endonuclease 2-like [Triticum aestivum]KAF7018977.1 hypothetical protein CFC21_032210 [Triticum aestivum]